jgi:trimeric autotransporter adhesin
MKKSFILAIVLTFSQVIISQVPEKMSYQAVVRNVSGELVKSGPVGIRISILRGSVTGSAVYIETHTLNTNANGLVSLEIGGGSSSSGTFTGIDWSSGMYFIKNETDPNGGTNYTISGTSQLLAVPFALYAKRAENGFSGNYNDLTNRPVLFDGNWANINSKPSTLTGYGITDALSISHPANSITSTLLSNWNTAFSWGNHVGLYRPISYVPSWNEITSKPTTLAGFGITDGVNTSGNQTIDGIKTFTGTISASNRAIINLANPTNGQDAATKSYVDSNQSPIIFQGVTQSIIGNNSPIINNGYRNVFIGKSSGMNNNSGTYNTFFGSEAGFSNRIGNNNVAIGQNALRENDEGSENIAIGSNALEKNKVLIPGSLGNHGFGNIAIGFEAMRNAISFDNIAIGMASLRLITEGTANTALGIHTMSHMTSGGSNTALGAAAMINSVSGNNNIAIGRDAGNEIAGSENVFIGNESGRINHGSANIFIGHLSGYGATWQNVSNRLIIHNAFNGTDVPLIYGEFDNHLIRINGTLNIRDVLKLTPRASAPASPTEGDIYYNSTTHKLMVFDGSSWMACW